MNKLVQWGAGNIGRSFVGQIFARNGWEVTFVDVDAGLIKALSSSREYRVVSVAGSQSETVLVQGIKAIHVKDEAALAEAIMEADCISFSVGKNVLSQVVPEAAKLITRRYRVYPDRPVDILIAENVQDGTALFRSLLSQGLPTDFPLNIYIGLVETSIGKMVPIQSGSDPLTIYAEPYNTLIVDRLGFIGRIPEFPELEAVTPVEAWVARKLYIHNLGHAASAYLGYRQDPEATFIWQVLEIPAVADEVRLAMIQAGAVLRVEFPGVFSVQDIQDHIDELLHRFANRALGDTLFRVGRDLARKLSWDDRLAGALLLARRHCLPGTAIAEAYRAGMGFLAPDMNGQPYEPDKRLLASLAGLQPKDKIRTLLACPEAVERSSAQEIQDLVDVLAQGL